MGAAREKGRQIGEALSLIDFSVSEKNYEALVRLPAMLFAEYVPDLDRQYERGEVVRMGSCKYLLQNWGKIDPDMPPPVNPLCKLFRDAGRYDWVREEYCIQGFERFYEDTSNPQNTGWYRVIAANAGDNNTPPPGVPNVWERVSS